MKTSKQLIFILSLVCISCLVACSFAKNDEPRFPLQYDEADTIKNYDLVIIGDSKPNIGILDVFLAITKRALPKYMIHMGDIVPFSSPIGLHAVKEALEILPNSINSQLVIGNHDVWNSSSEVTSANIDIYFEVIGDKNYPNGYRTLVEDNYVLILLNSCFPLMNDIDETQYTWLENELDTYQDRDIFVFLHHPIIPSGYHQPIDSVDRFKALMSEYNVHTVVSGHEHLYYKDIYDSVTYITTGGAGSDFHETELGTAVYHILGVTFDPFNIDILDIGGNIIEI